MKVAATAASEAGWEASRTLTVSAAGSGSSPTHFAYSVRSSVTGVPAKSNASSESVAPPSALVNQPANVLPSFVTVSLGAAAYVPFSISCAAGVGEPPIASNVIVTLFIVGAGPKEFHDQRLADMMVSTYFFAAAATS